MSRNKPGLFASSLRELVDHPKCFSRQEWAEILRVTPSAISQWLGDYTVPRASTLRSIIDVAKRYCGAEAIETFSLISSQPAESVSPLGNRMLPTVAHYLVEPIREGFLRVLGTISPKNQEIVLLEAAEHCQALRNQEDLILPRRGLTTASGKGALQPSNRSNFSTRIPITRRNRERAEQAEVS